MSTFLDAAEKVLDKSDNQKPMNYKEITEQALKQGWLNTSGKTPEYTMNALLSTDIKNAEVSGLLGRFIRTSSGYYGLTKWMDNLPYQISKHNLEVIKKILSQLGELKPTQFEELVKKLLDEMGFENTELTKPTHDKGIDVRGTLPINNVIHIKMAVQVKLQKDKISRPIVQNLRGSLNSHEQGLIITTSDFSDGAREEANQQDMRPVNLINGEQLVILLMEYKILEEYNISASRIPLNYLFQL